MIVFDLEYRVPWSGPEVDGMYFNELVAAYDQQRRERNIYHDLMRFRIREVLLVGSLYDSFVVESDGVLTEQIYGEYFKLNLNTVPRVQCAYTAETALDLFTDGSYDLVILMAGLDFNQPLEIAAAMKRLWPDTPILLMVTNNTSLASLDMQNPRLAHIDRIFVWNGYSKLFVGMIKYVEDLRNVDSDTRTGQVRVILLIEDSVRYYSRYLPVLYKVVMRQTQALIEEEKAGETFKLLSMRARPKILLASSYEEAVGLFEKYEPYILTVITDLRFPHKGVYDENSGFEFLEMAKSRIRDLPVLVQSSEKSVREHAFILGASFADKNSESLEHELAAYLQENLGFGPFRFRDPSGAIISTARNMEEFMFQLYELPAESIIHHARRNHFSAWLMARGEIQFAKLLKNYKVDDFDSALDVRDFIMRIVNNARRDKSKGVVPAFDEAFCRDENCISRLGDGSVGGKGRGLIFIRSLLENLDFSQYLRGIEVKIPRTAFIGIDEFERFLESNGLWSFAYYEAGHEEIRRRFLVSPLSIQLIGKLRRFAQATTQPLAIRSSGLFEDMLMVPFSGIYDTYIIPNSHPDPEVRVRQMCDAIRLIYASLFSKAACDYFETAGYNLEEERMAIVIQEVVGKRRGRYFYPHLSGTAQSYNYYPVSYVKPEDGLCISALGLGCYVVEGGVSHQFSPRYPKIDVVSPEHLIQSSQRVFRALDMSRDEPDLSVGEDAALAELPISEAETDPMFNLLASTWDTSDRCLVPGAGSRGPKFINLANILKYDAFPFAQAIEMILQIGSRSMAAPVEIEYALNIDETNGIPALYLLQLKPLMHKSDTIDIDFSGIDPKDCVIVSGRSMGNGRDGTITDIVWVDPTRFDRSRTMDIASEIEEMDTVFRQEGRRYLLIGPGRWGTRDRWLGVPVTYPQISKARVIVEADLPGFHVESSLGSHFFHNVTSMNIGYLTVPSNEPGVFVDWAWLDSLPRFRQSRHCNWSRLEKPLDIRMDGRNGRSVVMKPPSDAGIA